MAIEATIKKWGNSLGVILPKDFVEKQGLKEHDTISLFIAKKADISSSFGVLKTRMTGQQFKDLVRKGWE